MSRQDEVATALRTQATFISAQQLHAVLRDAPRPVGLTTVYRCLQRMVGEGTADAVHAADGEVLYRACRGSTHHHHLVCRSCGEATEIDAPMIEEWAAGIASDRGFSQVAHTVELFGVCPRCQA
jgi:Fur family ferric uptake transcriptional regulator